MRESVLTITAQSNTPDISQLLLNFEMGEMLQGQNAVVCTACGGRKTNTMQYYTNVKAGAHAVIRINRISYGVDQQQGFSYQKRTDR